MRLHQALAISPAVRKTTWPAGHYYLFRSKADLTGCHFEVTGTENIRTTMPLDWLMDENWEPVTNVLAW